MKQILAVRVGAKKAVGAHCVEEVVAYWYVIRSSFWQAVATAALGWAALGSHLQTKIWHFRDGVCHLMNFFLRTMFKLRQGPGPILGTFFGH